MPCEDVVAVDGGGVVSEIQCSTPSFASGGSVDLGVATLFGVGNLTAAFDFVRCVDVPAGDCRTCIAHQATCGFCVSLNGCGTSSTCGDFVQACAEIDAIAPTSGATPGGTVVTVWAQPGSGHRDQRHRADLRVSVGGQPNFGL